MTLDIKQRGAILELVLANDADRLKDNSVLHNSVAKGLSETSKVLESCIERLVASSSTTLEPAQVLRIMGTWRADFILLAEVALVTDRLLAFGNFVLEPLSEDGNVMFTCREWTVHPNKSVLKYGETKLIVKARLLEFVAVVLGILGQSRVLGLTDSAMNPINSDKKDRGVFIIGIPCFWPNDLGSEHGVRQTLTFGSVTSVAQGHNVLATD